MNRRLAETAFTIKFVNSMDSPSLPVSKAITKVCKTSTAFSAISDVKAPDGGDKLDMQESFVFAEVLKYVYLLHLEVRH